MVCIILKHGHGKISTHSAGFCKVQNFHMEFVTFHKSVLPVIVITRVINNTCNKVMRFELYQCLVLKMVITVNFHSIKFRKIINLFIAHRSFMFCMSAATTYTLGIKYI